MNDNNDMARRYKEFVARLAERHDMENNDVAMLLSYTIRFMGAPQSNIRAEWDAWLALVERLYYQLKEDLREGLKEEW